MIYGILNLSLKGYLISLLVLTQITLACVTIYLHRAETHRALKLNPLVRHFFRFWLWMTTGIRTKEWVAIHRKHHAKCETPEDPHSPQVLGLKKILLEGAEVYKAGKTKETIERFGHDTPDDWLERHVYTLHDRLGVALMLVLDVLLFGIPGISIWALQMIWVPLFAGGIVNGVGHYFGYRNYESKDASTNIIPLAIFIGGEELHNNHHAFPTSAKLSNKWWEFDIGWFYICVLRLFRLATVKHVATKLHQSSLKPCLDLEKMKLIISHRLQVISDYSDEVILPIITKERKKNRNINNILYSHAKKILTSPESLLTNNMQLQMKLLLSDNPMLAKAYQYKVRLQKLWDQHTATQQELFEKLKQWVSLAESDSNPFIRNFASRLLQYSA